MGSHSDKDTLIPPKILSDLFASEGQGSISDRMANLERRAVKMSEKGENLLTAGRDGESVLLEEHRNGVLIRRLPADPDGVLRISIGAPEWADDQAYLVFRGDPNRVRSLLHQTMAAFGAIGGEDASDQP